MTCFGVICAELGCGNLWSCLFVFWRVLFSLALQLQPTPVSPSQSLPAVTLTLRPSADRLPAEANTGFYTKLPSATAPWPGVQPGIDLPPSANTEREQ